MRKRPGRAAVLAVVACALLTLGAAPRSEPPEDNPFSDLGEPPEPTPEPAALYRAMLVILDASGSMNGQDGSGSRKIDTAKRVLGEVLDELPRGVGLGLQVYGHRAPNSDREAGCADTELLVPVGPVTDDTVRDAVGGIGARGYTPISLSLTQAADQVPDVRDRSIVLISDGVDTCGPPAPCDTAREIAARQPDLRVNTIGFRVDAQARTQLQCIADVTGGAYFDASDDKDLFAAFRLYELRGERIRGGDTAATALPLEPGQYIDALEPGQERWYRLVVEPGTALASAATLVPPAEGLRAPGGQFFAELRSDDVLGALRCERDTGSGIGLGLDHVAVRSAPTNPNAGLCGAPGERLLRVGVLDAEPEPFVRSLIAGETFDVELLVEADVEPAQPADGTGDASDVRPAASAPSPSASPAEPRSPVALLVALLAGIAGGIGTSRLIAGRRRP